MASGLALSTKCTVVSGQMSHGNLHQRYTALVWPVLHFLLCPHGWPAGVLRTVAKVTDWLQGEFLAPSVVVGRSWSRDTQRPPKARCRSLVRLSSCLETQCGKVSGLNRYSEV